MSSWGAKAQMEISGKAITPEIVKGLWAEGARRVIVGVSDVALAREQMQVCADGGLELQAYSFMYWGADNAERLDRVRRAAEALPLTMLWVDLEDEDAPLGQPGAVANWCLDCVALAERLEWPVGIYSAAWWWRRWLGEWDGLHDLPLWVAQYDGIPNLDFSPFGGWRPPAAMKQYCGTTEI
jgi:hypothetical protein